MLFLGEKKPEHKTLLLIYVLYRAYRNVIDLVSLMKICQGLLVKHHLQVIRPYAINHLEVETSYKKTYRLGYY